MNIQVTRRPSQRLISPTYSLRERHGQQSYSTKRKNAHRLGWCKDSQVGQRTTPCWAYKKKGRQLDSGLPWTVARLY